MHGGAIKCFFIVWLFADHLNIMESPASVTVNASESANFTCTAAGSGDLNIKWICSDGSNCGIPITDDSNDGNVTSTFVIDDATSNLTVTCVVNQSLTSLSSGGSNVEVRLPPDFVPTKVLERIAQLIVIPAPTTTQPDDPPTQDPASTADGELK